MKEAVVQRFFVEHLRREGWAVNTASPDHTDVIAERDGQRIVAEVKGLTAAVGTDVDTLYGQSLRRMTATEGTRFAVVVPASLAAAVRRVPSEIRRRLAIEVWLVADDGTIDGPHDQA